MNIVDAIKDKKDIEKLKKHMQPRIRLAFTVGINSALRISDILALRVGDVLDVNGKPKERIVLKEAKTKKRKEFPLNKKIHAELKKLEYSSLEDYLFPSQKGGAISRIQAYRLFNEAAERAGLDFAFGTHSMRKTWGYHAIKSGVPLHIVQKALNHSSSRETLRYIGLTQEVLDDVYMNITL